MLQVSCAPVFNLFYEYNATVGLLFIVIDGPFFNCYLHFIYNINNLTVEEFSFDISFFHFIKSYFFN